MSAAKYGSAQCRRRYPDLVVAKYDSGGNVAGQPESRVKQETELAKSQFLSRTGSQEVEEARRRRTSVESVVCKGAGGR